MPTKTQRAELGASLEFCFILCYFISILLILFYFIFYSIYYLRPSFLSPSYLIVVTQIRGHMAGSSPPLPTAVRSLRFYRVLLTLSLVRCTET